GHTCPPPIAPPLHGAPDAFAQAVVVGEAAPLELRVRGWVVAQWIHDWIVPIAAASRAARRPSIRLAATGSWRAAGPSPASRLSANTATRAATAVAGTPPHGSRPSSAVATARAAAPSRAARLPIQLTAPGVPAATTCPEPSIRGGQRDRRPISLARVSATAAAVAAPAAMTATAGKPRRAASPHRTTATAPLAATCPAWRRSRLRQGAGLP